MELRNKSWLVLSSLVVLSSVCSASRILAAFPDTSRSHLMAFEPLLKTLATRGHHLTVISSFPQKTRLANYRDIAVPLKWFGLDEYIKVELNSEDPDADSQSHLHFSAVKRCRYILSQPQVNKLIHSKVERFDLIILDLELSECFLGFAHKYNASVIGVYPQSGPHWMYDLLGNTSPYSYLPNMRLFHTDKLDFFQRIKNAHSIYEQNRRKRKDDNVLFGDLTQEFFATKTKFPSIEELQSKFVFLFFNNHVSMGFPRPLLPNVKDIPGMHIEPAGTLSQELQTLLDDAKNGAVVFSMGSHVGTFLKSTKIIKKFTEAFAGLKQLVIWLTKNKVANLPSNVRLMTQIPQADMLAHPNVHLLITHGGLLSLQEAVYHAVPIVGLPIYGDQFFNVQRAQDLGYGIRLNYKNLTSRELKQAVKTITTDGSYQQNATLASARFRDNPLPPLETAVFWTEYVLRHEGARHLRCAALDLEWYQYFLLDVIAVLFIMALILVLLMRILFFLVFNFLFGDPLPENMPAEEQKKTN